jgi:poly(hydroxyalkanoate) granule-associated protein
MTEALTTTDPASATLRGVTTVAQRARRLWLAGLGVVGVTVERARDVFATLEQKGEQLEPAVTAPLRRAGETATRVAERAGMSVKSVGGVVSSATSSVADVGARFRMADVTEEVQRIVDEKLAAVFERLDIPTKADLQALAERIEELAPRGKRNRESHHGT